MHCVVAFDTGGGLPVPYSLVARCEGVQINFGQIWANCVYICPRLAQPGPACCGGE